MIDDGTVQCTGYNDRGDRHVLTRSARAVAGIHDAVQIAAADEHACAQLASGSVRCWGSDSAGELGIGFAYENYPHGLAKPAEVILP